jgi:hypothetical protein
MWPIHLTISTTEILIQNSFCWIQLTSLFSLVSHVKLRLLCSTLGVRASSLYFSVFVKLDRFVIVNIFSVTPKRYRLQRVQINILLSFVIILKLFATNTLAHRKELEL